MHRWIPAILVALLAPLVFSAPSAATPELDAVVTCRKVLIQEIRKTAAARRQLLLRCTERFIGCALRQELAGHTCLDRQISKPFYSCLHGWERQLAHILPRTRAKMVRACTAAYAQPPNLVMDTGPGALGFAGHAQCGTAATLEDLVQCLQDAVLASVEEAFGGLKPRSGILMDSAGLGLIYPHLPRPDPLPFPVLLSGTGPELGVVVDPGAIAPAADKAVRFAVDGPSLSCGRDNGSLIVKFGSGTSCADLSVVQQFELSEPYGAAEIAVMGPYPGGTILSYCVEHADRDCAAPSSSVFGPVEYAP